MVLGLSTKEKFFESKFTLKYSNSYIESEYVKATNEYVEYYVKWVSSILLLASLITSTLNFLYRNETDTIEFMIVKYVSYTNSLLNILITVFSFLTKEHKTMKNLIYAGYVLFLFTAANFKYPLIVFVYKKTYVLMIILLLKEILFRLLYGVFYLLTFVEYVVLNLIGISLVWLYLYPTQDPVLKGVTLFYLLCYTFLFCYFTFFSYFVEKQQKTSFYYKFVCQDQFRWLNDLLENINTGILSVKENGISKIPKISFVNSSMKKIIHIPEISEPVIHPTERGQQTCDVDLDIFLRYLFTDLDTSIINENEVLSIVSKMKTWCSENDNCILSSEIKDIKKETLLQKLISEIKSLPVNDSFIILGEKKIMCEGSNKVYTVNMRINKNKPGGEQIDFVFNDVSQTRQIAEFKYKTLFLSKVAHEFKNPIICITELISQLSDPDNSPEDKNQMMIQVKSLSNFLLVLVKDLNYFSESEMGKDISVDFKAIEIDPLLKFCEDVTLGLMKKLNRENLVLKVFKEVKIKTIFTDEWKLKQVLLNLLSNAIKFTYRGNVWLNVMINEHKSLGKSVQFTVKDEGIGIKEENKKNLFQPFCIDNMSKNEMGSGLGLNIVKDICSKLGGVLEFDSVYEEGSNFTVWIPYRELPNNETSRKLDKSHISYSRINEDCSKYSPEGSPTIRNEALPQLLNRYELFNNNEIVINILNLQRRNSFLDVDVTRKHSFTNRVFTKRKSSLSLFRDEVISDRTNKINSSIFILNNDPINYEREVELDFPTVKVVQLNIIITDDEKTIRQSAKRLVESIGKELNINLNIYEAEDGIECLYFVYKAMMEGNKIDLIFSDENMQFLKGSKTSLLIKEILEYKKMKTIPFYLVTAYDQNYFTQYELNGLTKLVNKPLDKTTAREIIASHIKNII